MPRFTPYLLVIPLAAGIGLGVAHVRAEQSKDQTADSEAGIRPELRERLSQNYAIANYKDYLVRELVAGRMTMTEVADEFLRVNAEEPRVLETVLRSFPGATDREKSAHNVIAFACGRCLTPAEESELLARLATEFSATFGHRPADPTT